jgi:hypothetical protein
MSTPIPGDISVYNPGGDVTGQATTAVVAKRFVMVSGNRTAAGPVAVAPATAAGRTCGVAGNDAAIGELVRVVRGNSRVVRVVAEAAIVAFAEVQVGAAGQAITKAAGVAVGYALTAAALGADVEVSLY